MPLRTIRCIATTLALLFSWPGVSLAEIYEVPGISGSVAVFRDTVNPQKFYYLPLALTLARQGGSASGFGIQIAKGEDEAVTLSVTVAVRVSANAQALSSLTADLRQRYSSPNIVLSLPARLESRLQLYRSTILVPMLSSDWKSSTVDGSKALSASVGPLSADEARTLLNGEDDALVVAMEFLVDGVVDGVASGMVDGQKLKSMADSKKVLAVGADYEQFLRSVLQDAYVGDASQRNLVRGSIRSWLDGQLGSPGLLRAADRFALGWILGSTGIATGQSKSVLVLVGSPHKYRTAATLNLGNICTDYSSAIVNLDSGRTGCAALH